MVRLFLDCDGVLADFDKGASLVCGMPPDEYRERYGLAGFWKRLADAPDFFASLDLMPDAMQLYNAVKHVSPAILTGTPRGDWAEPQKRAWAARHFPGVEIITTRAALKREYCNPGDILVDDRLDYAHLWENAGGVFVRHTDAKSTIVRLRRMEVL